MPLRHVSTAMCLLALSILSLTHSFGQIATVSPQNPKVGDVITVTYNPDAQKAVIQRPSQLILQTLVFPEIGSTPTIIESPMTKSGRQWRASLKLEQTNARFLLYQFVSGDLKDDNVERGWDALVVGPDGKALPGGHYWKAAVLAFGGYMGFKHHQDAQLAKSEIALERKQYPAEYHAVNLAWYLETNPTPTDVGRAKVKKELEAALKQLRGTDEALPMLLVWFEQTGQQSKADSLRQVFIAENPKGSVASAAMLNSISKQKDPLQKIPLYEKLLADFPMKESDLLSNIRQLVPRYIQAEKYDKAFTLLNDDPKSDPSLYSNLASPMVGKGVELDKAVEWLTHAIDIVRKQDVSSRVSSSTTTEWQRSHVGTLSTLLNIRGAGLLKLKRMNEAEADFVEAYSLSQGNDLLINTNLIGVYNDIGKFTEAVRVGIDCIRRGKSNPAIIEKYKTAYAKVNGSLTGYDKAVQDAKMSEEAALLKSALNEPAPDFLLKDVTGVSVNLRDLRGKVVLLDFWATWNGPAKASFTYLQKLVERYQYYRNVSVLALNTSEPLADAAREAAVKKFIEGGKYGIHVLYDNGSAVSQKFGVEGIPSIILIDRKGNIRFKRVGLGNGDEMVKELTTQIDLLLKR